MKLPGDASRRFLAGAVCKLSPQDKNDGNNRKARDNVEHIFGDDFEHSHPPCWIRYALGRSKRRSIKLGLYFDKQQRSPAAWRYSPQSAAPRPLLTSLAADSAAA